MPDTGLAFKQGRVVSALLILGVHLLVAFSVTMSDHRGRANLDRGELREIEVRLVAEKGASVGTQLSRQRIDDSLPPDNKHDATRVAAKTSQQASHPVGDVLEPAHSTQTRHYYTKEELRSPPQFQSSSSEQPVVPGSVASSPLTVTLLIGEDGHVDAVEFDDLSTSLATREYMNRLRAYLLGLKFSPGVLTTEAVPSKLRIFVSAEPM